MKTVIIDDHQIFREVLRKLFTQEFGWVVCGESDSGEEGLELIMRLSPDLIVLDLQLCGLNGFQVLSRLSKAANKPRVLVVSAYCDRFTVSRLEPFHIHGFVDKTASSLSDFRKAAAAFEEGKTYFSARFIEERRAQLLDSNAFYKLLSDWEQKILALVGRGFDDNEIAALINI